MHERNPPLTWNRGRPPPSFWLTTGCFSVAWSFKRTRFFLAAGIGCVGLARMGVGALARGNNMAAPKFQRLNGIPHHARNQDPGGSQLGGTDGHRSRGAKTEAGVFLVGARRPTCWRGRSALAAGLRRSREETVGDVTLSDRVAVLGKGERVLQRKGAVAIRHLDQARQIVTKGHDGQCDKLGRPFTMQPTLLDISDRLHCLDKR